MSELGLRAAIVVISDRVECNFVGHGASNSDVSQHAYPNALPDVVGGYLERLPLAAIRAGLARFAEIWHYRTGQTGSITSVTPYLARRVFSLHPNAQAPFHSEAMLNYVREHGAPKILCVWGLGVSEAMMEACSDSFIIYNSIDAPALRVPENISRHFDLVLTGAQWQSDAVVARHPEMATAIMPIGPEFASPETFFPTGDAKLYDVIYVAAAQGYKRHDVLFAALARAPRALKTLCVMGYGENAEDLRRQAAELSLDVTFIDPPGVSHAEVNRLMNQARVGVVCGVDDGAPAILTEYMLAGLPVVANAELACGLQYILPDTGLIASADRFEQALIEALDQLGRFSPRQAVIDRWAWPLSIKKLELLLQSQTLVSGRTGWIQAEGGSFEPAASA